MQLNFFVVIYVALHVTGARDAIESMHSNGNDWFGCRHSKTRSLWGVRFSAAENLTRFFSKFWGFLSDAIELFCCHRRSIAPGQRHDDSI
jgi:hypothetical protein